MIHAPGYTDLVLDPGAVVRTFAEEASMAFRSRSASLSPSVATITLDVGFSGEQLRNRLERSSYVLDDG